MSGGDGPAVPAAAEEEISLLDLAAVLWRRRRLIAGFTAAAAVGVVVYSVVSLALPPEKSYLPNEYTPQAHMLINNAGSSGGGLQAALSASGLGSLAGLAGVNVGGTRYSDLAQYLMGTNTFLDAVSEEFDLASRYKIKKNPRSGCRKVLKKRLSGEYDEGSGVFTIGFTDIDGEFARGVVNYSIRRLGKWFDELGLDKNALQKGNYEENIRRTLEEIRRLEEESRRLEQGVSGGRGGAALPAIVLESGRLALELGAQQEIYRQLKVQLELVNVAMASETPVFQVLELAETPETKSGPGRGLLCIIVSFAGFFGSVFMAFGLNAVENIRDDPAALAKLRGIGQK